MLPHKSVKTKTSKTDCKSDKNIQQLNIAYKEQVNVLKLLKIELDNVYNSDKKLSRGGISQAENSEIHACIPHRIREKLNLKQVVFREHYRHFQKLFTNTNRFRCHFH